MKVSNVVDATIDAGVERLRVPTVHKDGVGRRMVHRRVTRNLKYIITLITITAGSNVEIRNGEHGQLAPKLR